MGGMFYGAELFNQDITSWNVSKVSDFTNMFKGAAVFNQNIRKWSVEENDTLDDMFAGATAFLTEYGIPATPNYKFFTQFVYQSETTHKTLQAAVDAHFEDAAAAQAIYGKLEKYDTSLVTDMCGLFRDRSSFNLDISGWNTSSVERFEDMFNGASSFNQNIQVWDTSSAISMQYMFQDATSFNQSLTDFDVSNVKFFTSMFEGATNFNSDVIDWDVSSAVLMNKMFKDAVSFDKEIRSWTLNDDANVDGGCYHQIFKGATAFTQKFGTNEQTEREFFTQNRAELKTAVGEFNEMEAGEAGYDATKEAAAEGKYGYFSNLYVKDPDMSGLFQGTTTTTAGNKELVLDGSEHWKNADAQGICFIRDDLGSGFHANNSSGTEIKVFKNNVEIYSTNFPDFFANASANKRFSSIISQNRFKQGPIYNNDIGYIQFIDNVNIEIIPGTAQMRMTEKVQGGISDFDSYSFGYTYYSGGGINTKLSYNREVPIITVNNSNFNRSITTWNNLQQVTNIESLFEQAVLYNKVLPTNMSSVTNIKNMFKDAKAFNQFFDINLFSQITDLTGVLQGTEAFDQDISSWNVSSVTTMEKLFKDSHFNKDISNWSVATCTNFVEMFSGSRFNYDIRGWNIAQTDSLTDMIKDTTDYFKAEFGLPDTVDTPDYRFFTLFTGNTTNTAWSSNLQQRMNDYNNDVDATKAIYGDINYWNTSGLTGLRYLTYGRSWNHDISEWNISNVNYLDYSFYNNATFNQNVSTKVVTRPSGRQYIAWDTSKVANAYRTFQSATAFNNGEKSARETYKNGDGDDVADEDKESGKSPINWNMSSATNTYKLFENARSFNQCVNSEVVTLEVNGVTTQYLSMYAPNSYYQATKYFTFYDCPYFNNGDVAGGSNKPIKNKLSTTRGYYGVVGYRNFTITNNTLDQVVAEQVARNKEYTGAFNSPFESEVQTITINGIQETYDPLVCWRNSYILGDAFRNQLAFNQTITNRIIGKDNNTTSHASSYGGKMFYNCQSYNNGGQPLPSKLFTDPYSLSNYYTYIGVTRNGFYGFDHTFYNCKSLNQEIPAIAFDKSSLSLSRRGSYWVKTFGSMFENCESLEKDVSAFMQSIADVVAVHKTNYSEGGEHVYLNSMFKNCKKLQKAEISTNMNIAGMRNAFTDCVNLTGDLSGYTLLQEDGNPYLEQTSFKSQNYSVYQNMHVNPIVEVCKNCEKLEYGPTLSLLKSAKIGTTDDLNLEDAFYNCKVMTFKNPVDFQISSKQNLLPYGTAFNPAETYSELIEDFQGLKIWGADSAVKLEQGTVSTANGAVNCLRSTNQNTNSVSRAEIFVKTEGTLSFDTLVSSEERYDFLVVNVTANQAPLKFNADRYSGGTGSLYYDRFAGNNITTKITLNLSDYSPVESVRIDLCYFKDGSVSRYDDRAYFYNFVLDGVSLVDPAVSQEEIVEVNKINLTNLFYGCEQLTQSIKISPIDVTEKDHGIYNLTDTFKDANKITSIDLSELNVTTLNSKFKSISDLETLLLSENNIRETNGECLLTDIESMCEGCGSLTTVSLPTLNNITTATKAFKDCTSLNVDIELNCPELVTADSTLEGCTAFNSKLTINGPEVTSITDILKGATSMSGDISLTLPKLTQDIKSLLQSCKSVYNGKVTLDAAQLLSVEGLFMNCTALNTAPELTLPVATSANNLFKGCTSLNQELSFNLPKVQILNNALDGCTAFNSKLTIDGPEVTSVTDILNGAISMSGDISLTLPKLTQDIKSLLQSCKSVYNGKLTLDAALLPSVEELFMDCTVLNTSPELTLPVATSANNLFKGCTSLNQELSLTLPKVERYESALEGCTAFNSKLTINGPEVTSVTDILNGATSMSGDISLTLPKLTQDIRSLLQSCKSVYNGKVTLDAALLPSVAELFMDCTALNTAPELTLPVATNAARLFKGCTSLDFDANLNMPEVTSIDSAFEGCTTLNTAQTLALPKLQSAKNLFKGCTSLNVDMFPAVEGDSLSSSSLTSIEGLFEGCTSLNIVPTLQFPAATDAGNLFKGCTSLNQDLSLSLPKVTRYESALEGCTAFNSKLTINGPEVTNITNILKGAISMSGDISLTLPKLTQDMRTLLQSCKSVYNGKVTLDAALLPSVEELFMNCTALNTAPELTLPVATSASKLLMGCTAFNSNLTINGPEVTNVTDILNGATSMTGDISLTLPKLTQDIRSLLQSCKSIYNGKVTLDAALLPSVEELFMDCTVLNTSPELTLPVATNAARLFKGCIAFNQPVDDTMLNMSSVETLESAFENCSVFNKEVTLEKTKDVTKSLKAMFKNCVALDSKLDIDSNKVESLESFLEGCVSFDNTIRKIDTTESVKTVKNMFKGCVEFNQNIENLETNVLEDMESMLEGCVKYDQNFEGLLNENNSVTNMKNLLKGCVQFNQCIEDLQTPNVTTMEGMFDGCIDFNQCLCDLNTSKVTNFKNFLRGCENFDHDLDTFDTSQATTLSGFLDGASSFNRQIIFNTQNVTDMSRMLAGTTSFNFPLNKIVDADPGEDTGEFTTANVTTMESFLEGATSFNHPLDGLDVNKVTTVESLLEGAASFNESLPELIGSEIVDNKPIVNCSDFLNGGYSTTNKLHIAYMAADFRYFGYWPNNNDWDQYGTAFTGSYDEALDYANNATPITTDGYFVLGIFFSDSSTLQANEVKKQMQKLMIENNELSVLAPNTNNPSDNSDNNKYDNTSLNDTIDSIVQNEEEGIIKQKKLEYLSLMIKYNNLIEKSKTDRTYNITSDPIEYVEVVELNDTLPLTDYISNWPQGNPMRPMFLTQDGYSSTNSRSGAHFWNADTFVFPTQAILDRIITSTVANYTTAAAAGRTYINWAYGDLADIKTTLKRTFGTTYGLQNIKSLLKNATSYSGNIGKIKINPSSSNLESVFEGTNVTDIPFTYIDGTQYAINSLKNTFKNATNFNGDVRTIPVSKVQVDLTDTIKGTALENTLGVPLAGFDEKDYLPANKLTVNFSDGSGFDAVTPSEADGWTFIDYYYYYATSGRNHLINFPEGKGVKLNGVTYTSGWMNGGRLRLYKGEDIETWDYSETIREFYDQAQIAWCWDLLFQSNPNNSDPHYRYGTGAWKIEGDQLLMYHSSAEYYGTGPTLDTNQCLITVNLESHSSPGNITFQYGTMNGDHAEALDIYGKNDGIIGISYGVNSEITQESTINYVTDSGAVFRDGNCPVQVIPNGAEPGTKAFDHKTIEFTYEPITPSPFPAGDYFELTSRYFMTNRNELERSLRYIELDEGLHDYFYGPFNQTYTNRITDMSNLFKDNLTFNRDISHWNVSNVTTMANMFWNAAAFNQDIGGWNVSKVIDMENLFRGTVAFNQDIGGWDVSKAEDMGGMFRDTAAFNQNIGGWDTSSVTDMASMFRDSAAFNQAIGGWNVSNVTNMYSMLSDNPVFNQDINGWDVSKVRTMAWMFKASTAFNQDIGGWNTSSVTDMYSMFRGTSAFNQNIGGWDTSSVTSMASMFRDNAAFNQEIGGWDTSSVTTMSGIFAETAAFNQDIGGWNVGNVTDMSGMFFRAAAFNQDIGGWNVSQVTAMNSMFGDSIFNQDIGGWDTSSVTNMNSMFRDNAAFDQEIREWEVASDTQLTNMFLEATKFQEKYNVGATPLYTFFNRYVPVTNEDLKNAIAAYFGDGISTDSVATTVPIENWITDNITDMNNLFKDRTTFNANIGSWNTSSVNNMAGMFNNASSFDQNIGEWNTSSVTNMNGMFAGASNFNQNICNWNVSQVTDMTSMFDGASSFDGRYAAEPYKSGRINTWNVQSGTTVTNMFKDSNIFLWPFERFDGVYKAEWFQTDGVSPIIVQFFNSEIPCFGEETLIYAKKDGVEDYHPIVALEKGDLVKTLNNGYLPISFIGSEEKMFNEDHSEIKDCLYTIESPEGLHPLTLTGRHSILVDDWSSHYAVRRRSELSSTQVEGKYILGAGYSTLFTRIDEPKCERVYHFALDGPENRYGVLANGILCETLDKNSVNKLEALVPNHETIQSMDLMIPDLTSEEPEPEV
jgi:surface protein